MKNLLSCLVLSTMLPPIRARSLRSLFTDGPMTVADIEERNMFSNRIVGGSLAPEGAYPWFAASTGIYYCGASLVAENVLLTAAHCADAFQLGATVYVGAFERGESTAGAQSRTVAEIVPHPQYDSATTSNDFMLLRLNSPVDITPVELNFDDDVPEDGDLVTTMGFGRTSEGGSVSFQLREVDVNVVSQSVCASQYSLVTTIDEDIMLCAGVQGGGQDSCSGDSGGPLVTADGKQVGVVSFGVGCARPEFSGVYARVSGVSQWLEENICDLSNNAASFCTDEPPPGPPETQEDSGATIQVDILHDYYSSETTFEIAQNGVVLYSGPEGSPSSFQLLSLTFIDVPAGEYTFNIYDSWGDGLGSIGQGSEDEFQNGYFAIYHVVDDCTKNLLAVGDHEFTFSKSETFKVPTVSR